MNTKAKRQALLMGLSDKAQTEKIAVLDKLELAEAKTKLIVTLLKGLPKEKSTLFILPQSQLDVVKAGRNIPGVTFIRADSLNVYDVIRNRRLVILQDALPVIEKTFVK